MSNQQPPDLNQVYKTFQGAHTTEANVVEMFYNEVARLQQENIKLRAELIDTKKLVPTASKKK